MLSGLSIRDMLIIDRLDLDFQPGLNVLTGETGAGKSILLDCLGFVLGWRGRAELVRQGATQGEVSAWFDVGSDHPVFDVLEEIDVPVTDELVFRRINTKDGRKTAYINDRRVSGEVLRRASETLLELHGQHDDRGLLNEKNHLDLLDDFATHQDLLDEVARQWKAMRAASSALEAQKALIAEAQEQEDFARHSLDELDKWQFEIGDDEALDKRRRAIQGAEKLQATLAQASDQLAGDGAEGALLGAIQALEDADQLVPDTFTTTLTALARAMTELGEAQNLLDGKRAELTFDANELEQVEERFFALRAIARKHNIQPDELPAFAAGLRDQLKALEQGSDDIAGLEAAWEAAKAAYQQAAQALTASRTKAASALDSAVTQELAPLKMERAVFQTQLLDAPAAAKGTDTARFVVQTNPGAPAGPLQKIASGGELSRFLLALKVCLHGDAGASTMIFDEIDRGVGGATADAVGRRLNALAETAQVLVVTHSPQVAALARAHWRVEKSSDGDETRSTVVPLSDDMRIDEVARMLSGDTVTDAAREAARSLLAG